MLHWNLKTAEGLFIVVKIDVVLKKGNQCVKSGALEIVAHFD